MFLWNTKSEFIETGIRSFMFGNKYLTTWVWISYDTVLNVFGNYCFWHKHNVTSLTIGINVIKVNLQSSFTQNSFFNRVFQILFSYVRVSVNLLINKLDFRLKTITHSDWFSNVYFRDDGIVKFFWFPNPCIFIL